ncbi:MAG: T9SS type A sorting domain-containing protein [Ignavibacteriae bacterium]|nr:T9SS type A sorting domain-containing protein [Ignavibacteriota bacterium]
MKRKNLQYLVIALALIIGSFSDSYSQWTIAGAVSGAGTFPSISVVDQNTAWVAGGTNTPAVFRTTNGGTSWQTIPTTGVPLDVFCVWARSVDEAYIGNGGGAGGTGGNASFYKTTDGGTTWTTVASTGGSAGFFNGIVFSNTMPSFGIAQSDPPSGVGNPYYVSVTTDGGATWNPTTPPGVSGQASAQNSIVVVDNMFYGFGLGNNQPNRCYLTSDGGATWYIGNFSVAGGTSGFVSGLAFSTDKMRGVAATSGSLPNIGRTTDGGVTWTSVNVGANFTGYCTMKWIENTNTVYISANAGSGGVVKKSTDGGLTWTTMTTSGLTGITHMEFKRVGTTVYGYAATANGAILKMTDVVTEVTPINSAVPSDYKLDQNYPNPFNPSTTINFSIPASSKVTLKIYDALGKEVANLLDEVKPAGNYSADFTAGSNLNSGIYFYTLQAGSFTSTKKLMLVK